PKLTEFIVRHFIRLKYVNLTNILLDRTVVPELLQQDCTPQKIVQYVEQFLDGKPIYHRQMDGFDSVRQLLGVGRQTPSDNAATEIMKFVVERKCSDSEE
ncbi:MAG: lipid-A-disaccharide synthase, partial [Alphaproteobacteria bacterium]|nr:lipid-A-disaccharide synthase [Alphaproteobacteria bacterium]